MDKMAKLRHLVNAAHNYAATEYGCTLTIMQEYKEDSCVVVGFYDDGTDPEDEDPNATCTVNVVASYETVPYNCIFGVNRGQGSHALIKSPADLFRLLYA